MAGIVARRRQPFQRHRPCGPDAPRLQDFDTRCGQPKIAVFLDLFDRAEQEELTYRTLATGTVEELRNAFRRGLSRG